MDTIKELFYGNIHPFERDVPKDSEGDKLNKLIIRHTTTRLVSCRIPFGCVIMPLFGR